MFVGDLELLSKTQGKELRQVNSISENDAWKERLFGALIYSLSISQSSPKGSITAHYVNYLNSGRKDISIIGNHLNCF